MGNCFRRLKGKKQKCRNQVIGEREFKDMNIIVVKGNICEEKIETVVSWCDCFLLNEGSYILKQAMNEKLKAEIDKIKLSKGILTLSDCVSTCAGTLQHAHTILHATLPVWKEGSDEELERFEEVIIMCLKFAISINSFSVGFTLETADPLSIPL